MDAEIERLCDFFRRLNKKEEILTAGEKQPIIEEDVSLENIEKFDDFLRKNGGHTGGWNALEHAVFLKLIKKQNFRCIIHLLKLQFPDISEDDIIKHNKWYTKYVTLKSKQEHALRYWRIKKDEKKQFENNEAQDSAKVKNQQKVDENVKRKIQRWKEERKRLHEELLREQKYEQRKKEEQKKLRQIILENKKRMIVEYKREKESLTAALKAAQQAEKEAQQKLKSRHANKMLKKYWKKDMKLLQNAQLKKHFKLKREQQKRELLELMKAKSRKHIRVGRDPIRLLVPTVEWKQKIKNINPADAISTANENKHIPITNIQHLTTPKWRRTLTEKASE